MARRKARKARKNGVRQDPLYGILSDREVAAFRYSLAAKKRAGRKRKNGARRRRGRKPTYRPSALTRHMERLAVRSAAAVRKGDLRAFAKIAEQARRASLAEGRQFHYAHWQDRHLAALGRRNPHPRGRIRARRRKNPLLQVVGLPARLALGNPFSLATLAAYAAGGVGAGLGRDAIEAVFRLKNPRRKARRAKR